VKALRYPAGNKAAVFKSPTKSVSLGSQLLRKWEGKMARKAKSRKAAKKGAKKFAKKATKKGPGGGSGRIGGKVPHSKMGGKVGIGGFTNLSR
jgi:hypothetical protein